MVPENPDVLSDIQREILTQYAEGKITSEIAAMRGCTVKNIEFHRKQITLKLGISRLVDLVHWAIAMGLVKLKYAPQAQIIAPVAAQVPKKVRVPRPPKPPKVPAPSKWVDHIPYTPPEVVPLPSEHKPYFKITPLAERLLAQKK